MSIFKEAKTMDFDVKKEVKDFYGNIAQKFKKIHTVHVLAVKRFHERKEIIRDKTLMIFQKKQ